MKLSELIPYIVFISSSPKTDDKEVLFKLGYENNYIQCVVQFAISRDTSKTKAKSTPNQMPVSWTIVKMG